MGKGKLAGPVVVTGTLVTLLSVVLDGVLVVLGGVVDVLGVVVGVLGLVDDLGGTGVVAGYEHCEQEASTVRLLGEQTSKGTWASAQMKAQQGS